MPVYFLYVFSTLDVITKIICTYNITYVIISFEVK